MTLDSILRCKEHVKKKKNLFNTNSTNFTRWQADLRNERLLYRQILKPVWIYRIQIWDCCKKNDVELVQTFQNKVLRSIVDASLGCAWWFIHGYLKVNTIIEVSKFAGKQKCRTFSLKWFELSIVVKFCDVWNERSRLTFCTPTRTNYWISSLVSTPLHSINERQKNK